MRLTIVYQVSFLWFQIRCNRLCKKLYKVPPSPCLNVRFWLWLWNLIRYAEILVFFSDRTIAVTSPVSLQLLLKSPFFRFNFWNLVHIRIRFHGFNKRVSAVTFWLHLFQPSALTSIPQKNYSDHSQPRIFLGTFLKRKKASFSELTWYLSLIKAAKTNYNPLCPFFVYGIYWSWYCWTPIITLPFCPTWWKDSWKGWEIPVREIVLTLNVFPFWHMLIGGILWSLGHFVVKLRGKPSPTMTFLQSCLIFCLNSHKRLTSLPF